MKRKGKEADDVRAQLQQKLAAAMSAVKIPLRPIGRERERKGAAHTKVVINYAAKFLNKSVGDGGVRGQRGASKWLATVQFDQKRKKSMAGEVVALI